MSEIKSIKINLSLIGNVRINFYDFANEIVNLYDKVDEFNRQKNIKHLGVISEVFECSHHTRYEYLMLQCFLVDVIENTFKGSPNAIGNIKVNNKEYSGNGLIKSWFLLSNFGHSYNTFGDEKSLLLFTFQRKGFRNKLISDLEDIDLQKYANEVIDSFDYASFHHVLSIWRINKIVRNQVKRKQILEIYKLFLIGNISIVVNKAKLELLKHLAYYAREVALISIDSHNTHIPFSINPLSTLLSIDVYESKMKNNSVFEVLYPLTSILINEIYLNTDVLTKQRSYEVNSLINIKKRSANYQEYSKIIEDSMVKGLSQVYNIQLCHFFRFKIEREFLKSESMLNEYRTIQTVKRNCDNVEASLDYNFITKEKFYDFYVNQLFERENLPIFIYNILLLLEEQINRTVVAKLLPFQKITKEIRENLEKIGIEKKTILKITETSDSVVEEVFEEINRINIPTFRGLLSSIIGYFLIERYTFEITDINLPYDYVTLKLANIPISNIHDNIKSAIDFETDIDRVHELKHLQKSIPKSFDGFMICSLCRIKIYDFSKPPSKRIITDIDSIIVKIRQDEFILEFLESKNTGKTSEKLAIKDLKDKFIKTLNSNAKGYKIYSTKGFGAKVRIKITTK